MNVADAVKPYPKTMTETRIEQMRKWGQKPTREAILMWISWEHDSEDQKRLRAIYNDYELSKYPSEKDRKGRK